MHWYVAVPLFIFIGISVLFWIMAFAAGFPTIQSVGLLPWMTRMFFGHGFGQKCKDGPCPSAADPRCRGGLCAAHCSLQCKRECIIHDQQMVKKMIADAPIMDKLILPRPIGRKIQF